MTSILTELWDSGADIYQEILRHPFNRELQSGTLEPQRFAFYIRQDSLYLKAFAQSLDMLSRRMTDGVAGADLLRFSIDALAVEQSLHGFYIDSLPDLGPTRMDPACFAYTNFLRAHSAASPVLTALAAHLPCFWIYREVGLHVAEGSPVHNPYSRWIDTYRGDEYREAVERYQEIVGGLFSSLSPQEQDQALPPMLDAYRTGAMLEWMFWEDAYHLRQLPFA